MAQRPQYIDLRANSHDSRLTVDLPSPRAGEIPPALSPLDQIAQTSRFLARQLEQPAKNGRRMSRLPTNAVESHLRSRPGYYRSVSAGEPLDTTEPESDSFTALPIREQTADSRHKSFYPVIQSEDAPALPRGSYRHGLSPVGETLTPAQPTTEADQDYFGVPRAQSPDGIDDSAVNEARDITPNQRDQSYSSQGKPRTLTVSSVASGGSGTSGRYSPSPNLLPLPQPSPGYSRSARASPSIRSVPNDVNEEVDGLSLGGSYDSLPTRQFSSGSSISNRAQSPYSPLIGQMPRSPSVSSDYSVGGTRLARPSFNFSRPLSQRPSFDTRVQTDTPLRQTFEQRNDSRTSLDVPVRQDSADSSLNAFNMQDIHTPVSMTSEDYQFGGEDDSSAPAKSYIYSKFDLASSRGRKPNRGSIGPTEFMNRVWADPNRNSIIHPRPHSPPSPPRTGVSEPEQKNSLAPDAMISTRGASFDEQILSRPSLPTTKDSPSIASSNSTIRPTTSIAQPSRSATTKTIRDMSAEEHVDMGIICHEAGKTAKSSYHLKIAAERGHPTGMVLYGLALRHGWGLKEDKPAGVKWLKQAVDLAQSEMADDENSTKQGKQIDVVVRKTHRARFALGTYELGQSYMKGWGVAQDKKMALRYYEIAGSWGDADALMQAGECYENGNGTKKDKVKAARFYRMAAEKGANMTDLNWIYKEKYMEPETTTDERRPRSRSIAKETPQKAPRDKSRTRSVFGRKKSFIDSAHDTPLPSR